MHVYTYILVEPCTISYIVDADGQWVRCDNIWVRPAEGKEFLETLELLVDGAAPLSMVFKLAISIEGM